MYSSWWFHYIRKDTHDHESLILSGLIPNEKTLRHFWLLTLIEAHRLVPSSVNSVLMHTHRKAHTHWYIIEIYSCKHNSLSTHLLLDSKLPWVEIPYIKYLQMQAFNDHLELGWTLWNFNKIHLVAPVHEFITLGS